MLSKEKITCLVNENIEVSARSNTKQFYLNLGYKSFRNSKNKLVFNVKILDLPITSHQKIWVKCPICKKIRKTKYYIFVNAKTCLCRSCNMKKLGGFNKLNLIGQRFTRLTVIKEAKTKNQQSYWLCKCDCGNYCEVKGAYLINKNTQSCGCLQKEVAKRSIINLQKTKGHYIYSEHSDKENLEHFHFLDDPYRTSAWKTIRKRFLEVNNICKKCGSTENLHIHHIELVKDNPKLFLVEENFITLCNSCHGKYHAKYNDINKQTLMEWLND